MAFGADLKTFINDSRLEVGISPLTQAELKPGK